MQEGHPIDFESGKLNKRESLKSMYDKEMLATRSNKMTTIPPKEQKLDKNKPQ